MIIKKSKQRFKISWLFVVLALAILLFDSIKNFLIYFLVVALHELAHAIVARHLGYKLQKFYIMPYGACLNYESNVFCGNDEIYISIAGPAINVILCVLCIAVWWLFPVTYYYLDYFCFCNLMLASFNLLPCFPLDGGRVLVCLLSHKIDREKAFKITTVLNYVLCGILFVLFGLSFFKEINYSYMFIAIFLFSGTISPNKYTNYSYLSLDINRNSIYKKGSAVKILAIDGSVLLYKIIAKFSRYKFNIVYIILQNGAVKVLSEINIKNLALKYSPTVSIDDIVNRLQT